MHSGKFLFIALALLISSPILPQSINSGTVSGTVTDQSSAAINGATVRLHNAVTGYTQSATTDATGSYRFQNVPQNNYELSASAPGFASATQQVGVRGSLPVSVNLMLNVASE